MTIQIFTAHSDDIPYSIPLYISKKIKKEKIIISYVFQITNYAPNLINYNINEVSKLRYLELKSFSDILNLEIDPIKFKDACIRKDYFEKKVCHNKPMSKIDKILSKKLLKYITDADLILFPLAIGNHIDHRIILNTGLLYAKSGKNNFGFYEDLPYSYEFSENYINSYIKRINTKVDTYLKKYIVKDKNFVKKKVMYAKLNSSQVSDKYINQILKYSKRRQNIDNGEERIWLKN